MADRPDDMPVSQDPPAPAALAEATPLSGASDPGAPAAALPVLQDARVRLRPLRVTDAADVFALYSDPEVCRYWSFAPWTRAEQAEAWLAERMPLVPPSVYGWALTETADDRFIGTTALFSLSGANLRAELGYSLLPARQGRGLARAAVRLALDYAFGPLGLERVEADVDPRNEPSWRLLEYFRFQREGRLRNRWRVGDEFADSWIYGLLKSDYRAGPTTPA